MRSVKRASVFVPGSIGNVGPGFDVLGLAVDHIGDRALIELRDDGVYTVENRGRDAEFLPSIPERNTAVVAARALLEFGGHRGGASLVIEKGLPLSGGMGGSAASSVAGAAAASFALYGERRDTEVILAALQGEALVSGRHLDNILPSAIGGFALSRCVDPLDYAALVVKEQWWVALVTPAVRIQTKKARALLSLQIKRGVMIQQMANVAGMIHAFATGDAALLRRSLQDHYAEPARKSLIPYFDDVKRAALSHGSIGCSISGSGPTIFSICRDEAAAHDCADAMKSAFREIAATSHVGPIAREGARLL